MIRLMLMIITLLLAACSQTEPVARGEARVALFKECMELAAKMPRQADDDVSDIVSQCFNQSHYMTNYIKETNP